MHTPLQPWTRIYTRPEQTKKLRPLGGWLHAYFSNARHRPEVRPSDLSDARVIREGPTIADVYIDISPFYGMAPATVSGYRLGGRRHA